MQVPPEQPMGPGGYPRPPGYGTPDTFPTDKVMGIILIILAALGACGSLALVGIGGFAGAVGGAAATANNQEGAAAVAAAGGGLMVLGIIMLAICVVEIVAATWMMKSLKKGFMVIAILGAIGLIINIVTMAMSHSTNFFGLGTGLIFPIYSVLRLMGQVGPKPIE